MGLDSTTTLAVAKELCFRPYALSFRYGQRHEIEIEAARRIAATLGVEAHTVIEIDLRSFGSALTSDIDVPKVVSTLAASHRSKSHPAGVGSEGGPLRKSIAPISPADSIGRSTLAAPHCRCSKLDRTRIAFKQPLGREPGSVPFRDGFCEGSRFSFCTFVSY